MEAHIKEFLKKIIFMVRELINGKMAENISEIMKKILSKVLVVISILTVESMKVNFQMTKRMEKVSLFGQMEDHMMESGLME